MVPARYRILPVNLVRFDTRPDASGWTIIDLLEGGPVVIGGVAPAGLSREDADELADLLNTLQFLRRARTLH